MAEPAAAEGLVCSDPHGLMQMELSNSATSSGSSTRCKSLKLAGLFKRFRMLEVQERKSPLRSTSIA